jgi:hypothetical protein
VTTPRKPDHYGPPHLPLLLILLLSSAATLSAQSNQVLDRLLEEKPASFGDAAYVILSAAGFVTENATGEEAAAAVADRRLLPKTPAATDPATLGQVCFLIMETQGLAGGLLYRLFPGPRYATRELAAQRLLKGYTHPDRLVTGEEVMWILGAVLGVKEKT